MPFLAPGATGGAHAEAAPSFVEVVGDQQRLITTACECAMGEWACEALLVREPPTRGADIACLVAATEAAAECFAQLHACDEASMTMCAVLLEPSLCPSTQIPFETYQGELR